MPVISTTTADKALKYMYLPVFIRNVYYSSALFKRLIKTSRYVYGEKAIFGRKTRTNQGWGQMPTEESEFPAPGAMGFAQPEILLKLQGGTIHITWVAVQKSKDPKGAFVPLMREAMEDGEEAFIAELSTQWWGDGQGILGYVESAIAKEDVDDTGIPIDDGTAVTEAATPLGNSFHYMRPGMLVKVIIGTTGVWNTATARTVQDDLTTSRISLDSDTTADLIDGDWFERWNATDAGAATAGNWYSMMGLKGIASYVDSNNVSEDPVSEATNGFQVHKRADYPWNRAEINVNPLDPTGTTLRPVTIEVVEELLDALADNNAKGVVGYMNKPVKNALIANALRDRGWTGGMKIVDGFPAYDFDGMPIWTDRHMWRNEIMALEEKVVKVHHVAPPSFFEVDGKILASVYGTTARKPMFEANMIYMGNLGCDDCPKVGVVKYLKEPKTTAVSSQQN